MANQLKTKWIGNNQVTGEKVLLENNSALRSKDAAGTGEVELIKVNASDKVVVKNLTVPVDADDAATKTYVDSAISGVAGSYVDTTGDTMTGDLTLSNASVKITDASANIILDASPTEFNYKDSSGNPRLYASLVSPFSAMQALDGTKSSGVVSIISGSSIKSELISADTSNSFEAKVQNDFNLGGEPFSRTTVTGTAGTSIVIVEPDNASIAIGSAIYDFSSTGLDMNSNKISNLLDPSSAQDAATKKYVDDENDLQLDLSGGSMTGNITMTGGSTVTGIPTPSNASDVANKSYVDTVAEGLHVHAPVRALANYDVGGSYNNGSSGVGAYLDLSLSPIAGIDGVLGFSVGQRFILAKQNNNSLDLENGIYYIADAADINFSGDIIKLTRAIDFDTPTEMAGGDFVFVQEGTQYADSGWVMTETVTSVGTTPVQFLQFSGAGSFTADGEGIELVGSQFQLELDGSTLSKSANGLKVASGGITNTEVSASAAIDYSKLAALTADRALQSDASGFVSASSVTNTELGYLSGVTSAIQTQLDDLVDDTAYAPSWDTITNAAPSKNAVYDQMELERARIQALEDISPEIYKKTLIAGDITNQYIDLPHEAVETNDFHVFADRLALHQGAAEDYTLSVVSGVTRITFLNDMVTPGQQQLAVGDSIYVRYKRSL